MGPLRGTAASPVAILVLLTALVGAQAPAATSYTLVSREGRRALPATVVGGDEVVALDDVASAFQATLKEDALAGGVTLTYRGRTIVAAANQATVSVNGRVAALPSPVVRSGRRWFVPIEFLQIALGAAADPRIVVRRASRLVLIGDVRVPRVTARVDAAGPPTRVTIEVAPAAGVSTATEAGRVTVRIEADALDLALPPAGGGLVAQVRAGDQPNTVVVVLEPGAGAARATSQAGDTAARVTIDVPPSTTAAPPEPPPIAAPPAPSITPDTLFAPRAALQTVVIDPGHGGEDVGVRGASGVEEKQIALDVARRLRTLLETRLGVRVLLTRDGDIATAAESRVATANNNKADLFLSLHANAAPSPAVAGAEVYYLQLDREGQTAREEVARGSVSMPVLGGRTRTLDIIPWDLAQALHVDDSAMLARFIAEKLGARVTMGPTPIRTAPLRLLEGLNMPAAAVEMAYLTNKDNAKLMASDAHKDAIAQALHDAIVSFRGVLEGRHER